MRRALGGSRREVLRLAGCGLLGAPATTQAEAAEAPGVKFKVLGKAAKWTAQVLLKQFTNYEQAKERPNG